MVEWINGRKRYEGFADGARVYNNAAISINTSTATKLTFNSEHYDTAGFHSTGSNTGRLTVPVDGIYLIGFSLGFAAHATGYRSARILVNGSTRIVETTMPVNAAATDTRLAVSCPWECTAGDYFEVEVYHSRGGALNIQYHGTTHYISPEFFIARVG